MWFRCSGGNGTGDGATITVTYSSQFYNKTMTCSKGSKTYTKITTSSGSTVFDVDESGTWTVTCNGVSRTVDVVLEYSTQMAITKTITVYSAASDTVSFTDVTGAKTVTTNTSGQGSVAITFIPNESIIFTSSVAKNPDDLSANYSKAVIMDENITEVYVMPNNSLYWWGYMSDNCEDTTTANGWALTGGSPVSFIAPTHNTTNISASSTSDYVWCGIGTKSSISSSVTKLHSITTGTSLGQYSDGQYFDLRANSGKTAPYSERLGYASIKSSALTKSTADITTSGNFSAFLAAPWRSSGVIYAFWYE